MAGAVVVSPDVRFQLVLLSPGRRQGPERKRHGLRRVTPLSHPIRLRLPTSTVVTQKGRRRVGDRTPGREKRDGKGRTRPLGAATTTTSVTKGRDSTGTTTGATTPASPSYCAQACGSAT